MNRTNTHLGSAMVRIWVGIDSGKGHHHGLVVAGDGRTLLSRRVANDEPELLKRVGDVLALADGDEAAWAIDMTGGEPVLLLALLVNHGQDILYMRMATISERFPGTPRSRTRTRVGRGSASRDTPSGTRCCAR